MFKDFLPVLKMIARFIGIYIVLLVIYQFYLNYFQSSGLDPFSQWVAAQSGNCQNAIGFNTVLVHQPEHETMWFYVKEQYTSRMVEGCNAISIMILFLAFIFVFYKGAKTFLFAIGGLVVIHIMNVLRIALINVIFVKYPEYGTAAHDYLFPAIIYGTIVALWIIWVKVFVLKTSENAVNE